MCFHTEQVLGLFKKYPQVGKLLQQHLLPCYEPRDCNKLIATAEDIGLVAGTALDYGPKEFSKEAVLRVLEYLTVPVAGTEWLDKTVLAEIVKILGGE